MSLIDTITNWFRSSPEPEPEPANEAFRGAPDELAVRRWEAAETTKLTRAQWRLVRDESINEALLRDLRTLRTRCAHEITTNPTIAGMVETHATDVVGPDGPTLQVVPARQNLTDKQRREFAVYAAEAEDILDVWAANPDFNEELSLAEMLRLWIRQLWCGGEFLAQKLTARGFSRSMDVSLRLHTIACDRIPIDDAYIVGGARSALLGIDRDKFGKRTTYYVSGLRDLDRWSQSHLVEKVPADMMLHGFVCLEPGQMRGVPWLASALPTIGDMRQLDRYVIEAAKTAASHAMVYYTTHKDVKPEVISGPMDDELRAGRMFKLPNGYEGMQIDGKHPGPQYVAYRVERQGEYGAVAQMPGSVVRQDSSRHNYASARIDRQAYQRGNDTTRNMIERQIGPSELEVLREAELSGAIRPRPFRVRVAHQWAELAHVDPKKEGDATASRLKTGETSLVEEWQKRGKRSAAMIDNLRRSREALEAAGFVATDGAIEHDPPTEDEVQELIDTMGAQTDEG